MRKNLIIVAVMLPSALCAVLSAPAIADPFADDIHSYTLGTDGGWGEAYLPSCISGPPDYNFEEFDKEVLKSQIFSLGIGGTAVVEFTDNFIVDGPGVDFTIFENGLIDWRNGEEFYEGAQVFVSADGVEFLDLGYAPGTMTGQMYNAIYNDPTFDPLDPSVSGGDSFDIAFDKDGLPTGLTRVSYVMLVDDGDGVSEGHGNSGFDLDAIAAVHSAPEPAALLMIGAFVCGISARAFRSVRRSRSSVAREDNRFNQSGV
jgi:hypothetical protein